MKKFTILIVLQMIFMSYVMADGVLHDQDEFKNIDNYDELCTFKQVEEKIFDAVCVTETEFKNAKLIEQKDGYQLVEYKNQELVYLESEYLEIPKNNCEKGKIPLFVQP